MLYLAMSKGEARLRVACGWLVAACLGTPALARAGGEQFDVGQVLSCTGDRDCVGLAGAPWCGPSGVCSACMPGDCGLDTVCIEGACINPCLEDLDCTAMKPRCDATAGACVECVSNGVPSEDCTRAEFCQLGFCVADVCENGETRCAQSRAAVSVCATDGSGFGLPQVCGAGLQCAEEAGVASCVAAEADTDTGDLDGTTGPGGGGPATDSGGSSSDATDGDAAAESSGARGCQIGSVPRPASVFLFVVGLLGWRRRR